MIQGKYVRRAAWLLLSLSLIAFTPSVYLHELFADHDDHAVVCGHAVHHQTACVYEDLPDCGVDQTVVHESMLLPLQEAKQLTRIQRILIFSPEVSFHDVCRGYSKPHRGPPVG